MDKNPGQNYALQRVQVNQTPQWTEKTELLKFKFKSRDLGIHPPCVANTLDFDLLQQVKVISLQEKQ